MLDFDGIRKIIDQNREYLSEKFFVQETGIFGSFIRGEREEGSDR